MVIVEESIWSFFLLHSVRLLNSKPSQNTKGRESFPHKPTHASRGRQEGTIGTNEGWNILYPKVGFDTLKNLPEYLTFTQYILS